MKRVLLAVLLVGCGEDKDWSGKPLAPQQVTVEGVTYTINIPKGLPKDADDPGDWSSAKIEHDHVPKVFTGIAKLEHETIDDFVKWEISNKDKMNLVRKETRPDGYAITDAPAGKRRIEATTLKRVGDKAIKCTAVQVGDGALPSYDKTRAMLEAICDSIAVK